MASRPNYIEQGPRSQNPSRTGTPSPRPDLPSPRSGDVPPALSPLDAFALQGRLLAKQFEQGSNGRRISRLPPITIANELARPRPGFFAGITPLTPGGSQQARPTDDENGDEPTSSGSNPTYQEPEWRPKSYYPTITAFDDASSILSRDSFATTASQLAEPIPEGKPLAARDYIANVQREISPGSSSDRGGSQQERTRRPEFVNRLGPPQPGVVQLSQRRNHLGIELARSNNASSLAPPRSPGLHSLRNQPSIRSVGRVDSGEDSDGVSIPGEWPYDAQNGERKMSVASSRPRSPFSPVFAPLRSPSISSEMSDARSLAPRGSVNFSRPMSRTGRTSVDARPSFDTARSTLGPSIAIGPFGRSPSRGPYTDDENMSISSEPAPAQSYIYAKYSLPRGRILSRSSIAAQELLTHKYEWETPLLGGTNVTPIKTGDKTPGNSTGIERASEDIAGLGLMSSQAAPGQLEGEERRLLPTHQSKTSLAALDLHFADVNINAPLRSFSADENSPISVNDNRPFANFIKGHKAAPSFPPATSTSLPRLTRDVRPSTSHGSRASPATTSTPFTAYNTPINPTSTSNPFASSQPTLTKTTTAASTTIPISATASDPTSTEAHLEKGISFHEAGDLAKSTYHLRIAARAGSPTAMLLYALACRHGWGMRANAAEAVGWLRKAVDSAGLEVAGDEAGLSSLERLGRGSGNGNGNGSAKGSTDLSRPDISRGSGRGSVGDAEIAGTATAAEKRTHKAQLALSIYELGVSYMNGWGVAVDKGLGLRCFEIAGDWGDADALAEAGFCYAKGVGCKKDLKRAARYYREAERRGVGMAGNSWIYKEKYMPKVGDGADVPGGEEDERGRRGWGRNGGEKEEKKTPRDKSRTRTIFGGRKKSAAN